MARLAFIARALSTVVAAGLLRPKDRGAPSTAYFQALGDVLRAHGRAAPTLVIDLERLDRNCARLRESVTSAGKNLRIVAKSLPCPELLRHVLQATGSQRIMTFHEPFLRQLVHAFPRCDFLLGKPMPVHAAESFYRKRSPGGEFDPTYQLQWLVDTPERLAEYAQLARALGTQLGLTIEIDVGLHRGGVGSLDQLDVLLSAIKREPRHLSFRGFMGYDAHIGKVPRILESRATSLAKAQRVYEACIARAQQSFPTLFANVPIFNGAGSPTFRLHGRSSPLNEVSVGSALVKPADFDLDVLADFEPAAFIATPVLKVIDGLHLPGAEALGKTWALWDPNRRRTAFIDGGRWLAKFESPRGLSGNPLYGESTNQAIVNASPGAQLRVDEYVYLRPTQSERVLLEFGDLVAVRGGKVEASWPVLVGS